MSDLFSAKVLHYYKHLKKPQNLPIEVEALFPFPNEDVWSVNEAFYQRFFNDKKKRSFLIGINPGRLGAGITGIPFTDPIRLKNVLEIENSFDQKAELSSKFIYEVIDLMGGPKAFYAHFYFTSVSPIGFVMNNKNLNYYDIKELEIALKEFIVKELWTQINELPCHRDLAFCLGRGKNFSYLKKLNDEERFFKDIVPLPHPRWVMQYRLKKKDEYLLEYQKSLNSVISS